MHGIRSAYSGDALVSPKLVATLLSNTLARTAPPADLGQIDTQLLTLIGRGLSNAEIGEELHLATSTVKTYVSRLLTRLDRRNRAALAALAYQWGLIEK
jgi:DNA-binding NarL/FixJ family response regulator